MSCQFSSADHALAQRLETAESAIITTVVTGQVEPAAGGYVIFGGVGSPISHAVGIGMAGPVTAEDLDRIEEFYHSRGAECVIDLCPLADPELIRLIQSRPYRVIEFNNVLLRRLAPGEAFDPGPARPIKAGEAGTWARVVGSGFADSEDAPLEHADLLSGSAAAAGCFLAACDGRPVAGAAMGMHGGVAWMFGDATLPSGRGRGLQFALIQARLARAGFSGCDLAGACVVPGTASHRNYLRAGFELVYMRVNVCR